MTCRPGDAGADLVEEDRALVGLRELADLVADRAGERAGRVAEQLAFQQRLGHRPAGDFDERLLAAAAAAMNGPGQQRLARAAFAGDQHGRLRVGDAIDHVEHALHAVIVADDVLQAEPQVELRFELLVLFDHFALRQRPVDRHAQLFVDQRLGEQVERAGPQRFDARFDRRIAGDQDDRRLRIVLAAMRQNLEAVAVGQADVGQHQVERPLAPAARSAASRPPAASTS